ncbi:hypothetical protein M23134_07737 [Microscilla marina ATCC 23134]|uniref:Uncharacterized protein n=1 Tax=Microscilla marina ATCC 23134 TaxID=313606 RepID=A1ZYF3_MICM2|nr:hypothetical protein M23134_07737 [Microscilla marina ATCC 23134]
MIASIAGSRIEATDTLASTNDQLIVRSNEYIVFKLFLKIGSHLDFFDENGCFCSITMIFF